MKKQWIFNSFLKDFWALWGLAFVLIGVLSFAPQGQAWGLLALVAYIFIDSGHAYATAFRTFFQKRVVFSHPIYIATPIVCFLVFFSWAYWGIPYLWSFVLYATFFHNTRQHYGILKWYEKLNGRVPGTSWFVYLLTVIPFIAFHFRVFKYSGIYHENEFFFYPQKELFLIFLTLNLIVLFGFLIFSTIKMRSQKMTTPVFFSILFPGLVNFYCFNLGRTVDQVLVPLVVIHGIAYFFLTARVLHHNQKRTFKLWHWFVPIIVLSSVFGFVEYLTQVNFVTSAASTTYRGQWPLALAVSVVIVPLITHYILDGFIWRKSDPEFSKVFRS